MISNKYQQNIHANAKQTEIGKHEDQQMYQKPIPQQTQGDKTELQHGEFNLDSQEYQQVFKVFDKDNTGEITIQQVYDLINKFEEGATTQNFSNLNLDKTANPPGHGNKAGPRGSTHGIGSKSFAGQNSASIYSNGTLNQQSKGHNNSSTYHHSRTSQKQATGNGYQQDNSKFSPSRKHPQVHNGGPSNIGASAGGSSNLMQLHPTQLTSNNMGQNNQHKYQDNNNRSPRRPKEGGHMNLQDGGKKGAFKMNGNGNDQHGNSGSDEQNGDNSDNNDIGSGIIQKNSKLKPGGGGNPGSSNNLLSQQAIVGNSQQITSSSTPTVMEFPNGKESLKFDEFVDVIRDSCREPQTAENYLVLAFSMFDRQKKGYISTADLQEVFELLGESISDEEVNTMIKIAGIKSSDKINFKEFVDFFYKID